MKIKALDRVLLVLLMLALIALCVVIVLAAWNVIPQANVMLFFQTVYSSFWYSLAASVAALIVFIVAVKLLFMRVKKPQQHAMHNYRIRLSENGEVTISASALEAIVLREARKNQAVRDCHCLLETTEGALSILLRISVLPGTNLVETSAELQTTVKQNVEALSGLDVKEVKVAIESTEGAPQSSANA